MFTFQILLFPLFSSKAWIYIHILKHPSPFKQPLPPPPQTLRAPPNRSTKTHDRDREEEPELEIKEALIPIMEAEKKAKTTEKVVSGQTEPWHKPKNGSVFPAKRRSVKQMMWDLAMAEKKGNKNKKPNHNNAVHPCSSELLVDDWYTYIVHHLLLHMDAFLCHS